jgi:hypothetical protein
VRKIRSENDGRPFFRQQIFYERDYITFFYGAYSKKNFVGFHHGKAHGIKIPDSLKQKRRVSFAQNFLSA